MSLPGMSAPFRGTGNNDVLHIEWTYSDANGAPSLDEDASDTDILYRLGVTTVVSDTNDGLTGVNFPKCKRCRVLHASLEVPTNGTSEKQVRFGDIDATAGTGVFVICTAPSTLANPPTNSRARLTLVLDR